MPILAGDAALAIPSELAFLVSPAALAIAGLGANALVAAAWRFTAAAGHTPQPPETRLGWLALAGAIALVPGAAGMPTGRVLVVPALAFAPVIATILARALTPDRRALGRALAALLVVAHVVVAPLLALHAMRGLARRGAVTDRAAREIRDSVPPGGRAILVAAADPYVFLYPRGVLAETAPGAVSCWSVLSAAASRHRLTRISDHALVLEALDRPLLGTGAFDTLFRADDLAFVAGDTVEQCGGSIRVDAVDPAGHPTRISVTYQRRLDDPLLAFLVGRGPHVERLALPPVGGAVDLDP